MAQKSTGPKAVKNSPKPNNKHPEINKRKLIDLTAKYPHKVESLLKSTDNYLNYKGFVEQESKIVCAVSGGVDSSVLLDCLVQLSQKYKYKLFIAHYNHNLRGLSSKEDADFVKSLAQKYNIPYYTASGNVRQYAEKNSFSIEHAARILRYNFFERTTRNLKADFIAMAHTADDSAETFFINLFRGSGLTGLSGIPEKRQFVKNVVLLRPFIDLQKSEIIDYCKARRLKYREDETNSLLLYTRNRVRHELLPMLMKNHNPAIIQTINRTAKLLRGADEVISQIVNAKTSEALLDVQNNLFVLNIQYLKTLHEFLQGEIIQKSLQKYLHLQPISTQLMDRILDLSDSPTGSIIEINKMHYCLKDRDTFIFTRRQPVENVNQIIEKEGNYTFGNVSIQLSGIGKRNVKFTEDPNIEFIDADLVGKQLQIRNWKPGDSFTPLGMSGSMKLSDFLINEKVPVLKKQKILVLTNLVDIIWICGMRLNDKYKVTKDTKKVMKLQIEVDNG